MVGRVYRQSGKTSKANPAFAGFALLGLLIPDQDLARCAKPEPELSLFGLWSGWAFATELGNDRGSDPAVEIKVVAGWVGFEINLVPVLGEVATRATRILAGIVGTFVGLQDRANQKALIEVIFIIERRLIRR